MENKHSFRDWVVFYIDNIARGLIAFFFIGIGFYILLVGFLKVKTILVLPFAFIVSVLFTPLLSKVKLGEILLTKYENWLKKIFKLT